MDLVGALAVVTLGGGIATGVGAVPGLAPEEWCRFIADQVPCLPHLPELPARGPGADMIGRTLSVLAQISSDFAAETTSTGWRMSISPRGSTRIMRRARSWLAEDLDAAEVRLGSHRGRFKIQLAGPLTMIAAVELPTGERALGDPGAVRDLTAALSAAVAGHVRDCARRFPDCELVLQLDEPGAVAALDGRVPTQSGIRSHSPVPEPAATQMLGAVVDAAKNAGAEVVIHCCASEAPLAIFARADADGVSIDLTLPQDEDDLGKVLDSGKALFAGLRLATADGGSGPESDAVLREVLGRIGFGEGSCAGQVVITPTCGLASYPAHVARGAYRAAVQMAERWATGVPPAGPAAGERP